MPKFKIDAHGRHSTHVRRACIECRRRKTKCNGESTCGTCITHRTDCVYSSGPDGRSKNWKDRATNLAQKLKAMAGKLRFYKAQVRDNGGDVSPSNSEPGSPVDEPSGQGALAAPIDLTYEIGSSPYASDGHSIASVGKFAVAPYDTDLYPMPAQSPFRSSDGLSIKIPFETSAYDPFSEKQSSIVPTKADLWSPPLRPNDPSPSRTSFSPSSHPSAKSPFSTDDPAQFLPLPISRDPSGRSSSRRTHSDVGHPSLIQSQSPSDCGMSSSHYAQYSTSPRVSLILRDGEEPLAVNSTSILALASRTYYAAMRDAPQPQPVPSPIDATAYAWNRCLPQPLTDGWNVAEHDAALNTYFEHASRWQPPVIGQLFLADMRSALGPASDGRTLHYSPGLHCAVLASAGALVPPTSVLAYPAVRAALLTAAREFIDADCESNVRLVPSILGLVVLARHHLAGAQGLRLAYSLITMACSLAVIGGLNSDTHGPQADRLERQWCYVSLFNQSVEIAVHSGQNPIIQPLHDGAQLQQQVNRLSLRDSALEAVLASETFVATSRLFVEMHTALVGLGARLGVAERVETLRRGVLERGGLDDAHLALLNAAYLWAQIVIRHPETRENSGGAAAELLNSLSAFVEAGGPSSVPAGLFHMAFSGGLAVLGQPDPTPAYQAFLLLSAANSAFPCAGTFSKSLWSRIAAVYDVLPDGQRHSAPPGEFMSAPLTTPFGGSETGETSIASHLVGNEGTNRILSVAGDPGQMGQISSLARGSPIHHTLARILSQNMQARADVMAHPYMHYPYQPS